MLPEPRPAQGAARKERSCTIASAPAPGPGSPGRGFSSRQSQVFLRAAEKAIEPGGEIMMAVFFCMRDRDVGRSR
jgi:hypothetical protein